MFKQALKTLQNGINTGINTITTAVSNITNQATASKFTVNNREYFEDHLIAEGGYGYIYQVTSAKSKRKYALKKINIGDKKQYQQVKNEIDLWRKLPKSNNLLSIHDFELTQNAAYILMELCEEGSLLDYVKKKQGLIMESEALEIVYNIANGLLAMHTAKPTPIFHRDIKIENILKFGHLYKICDFGSCSTKVFDPSIEDAIVKAEMFNTFEKNSTFYYRPPEMCDQYSNYIVNDKVDIWALGCVLYAVLFKVHPFQEAQKLTIISAQYTIPKEGSKYSEKMIDLIRVMLTPNPALRPSAQDIINFIQNWTDGKDIPLCDEVKEIKNKQTNSSSSTNKVGNLVMMSEEEIEKAQKRLREKEKNTVSNGSNVGVVGENKNLWDFDFEGEASNSNTNNNVGTTNTNNPNIIDFEFTDDTNTNTNNNVGTTNTNNPNILDFDFISPSNPIPTINSSPIPQQSSQTVNNPSSTGWDFTFGSTSNPIPTAQSNPTPIVQPQQTSQPLFDFQIDNTSKTPTIQTSVPNTTTTQQSNQDILSFFQ